MAKPVAIRRYLVDRAAGMTSNGLTEIVVLCFTEESGREYAVSLSKVDARILGSQLQLAAIDAQNTRT